MEKPQTGRKTLPHTPGNILLHMIFSTQGRLPLIKAEFRHDLFAYLGGIIRFHATARTQFDSGQFPVTSVT